MENKNTATTDIREMMAAWNHIEATAKAQFPLASSEEIYCLAACAMRAQLGMEAR